MEKTIQITSEVHKCKLLELTHNSLEEWVSGVLDAEYAKLIAMEKENYINERLASSQPIHIESDEHFVDQLIASRSFSTAKELTEDFNERHTA